MYYSRTYFLESFPHNCHCNQMEIRQSCLCYTCTLKHAWNLCQNWLFYQTFQIIIFTKLFHIFFFYFYIKFTQDQNFHISRSVNLKNFLKLSNTFLFQIYKGCRNNLLEFQYFAVKLNKKAFDRFIFKSNEVRRFILSYI